MVTKNFAVLSWISLVLAIILLVSPWIFGFEAGASTISSIVVGAVVGLASISSLSMQGWRNTALLSMVMGVYLFLAPMLFHFAASNPETWIQMVAGAALWFLSALQMWKLTALNVPA